MSDHDVDKLEELRQTIRDNTEMLRNLVEHPEVMDEWTPAQLAWFKEHLEHNREELVKLHKSIMDLVGNRPPKE